MFNNEEQGFYSSSMDPRISFSNDFADIHQAIKHENSYREAPVSSDFEFSVKNYTMKPADEIFFKGVLLPSKDNCTSQPRKMTLREELLVGDDYEFEDSVPRLPKSLGRWKERLGLKRTHIESKKGDRSDEVFGVVEHKQPAFVHEEQGFISHKTQDMLIDEGLNCRDYGI